MPKQRTYNEPDSDRSALGSRGGRRSPQAIEAPWGEDMVVKPGDAVVQNQGNPGDIYRIYGPAFDCNYEIVSEPAHCSIKMTRLNGPLG